MEVTFSVSGDVELDRAIKMLIDTGETSPKSINTELRKACREAVKQFVLPGVIARVSHDTGFLESQITIRAIKRSRGRVGYWCGFPDKLYSGPTYYAGYLEFGWDHRGGVHVQGDGFLRVPLYENESKIRAYVASRLAAWVAQANKMG